MDLEDVASAFDLKVAILASAEEPILVSLLWAALLLSMYLPTEIARPAFYFVCHDHCIWTCLRQMEMEGKTELYLCCDLLEDGVASHLGLKVAPCGHASTLVQE